MKLQQIKIKKSTAKMQVQNITHKLQGIKTVGYINIIAKNKVQTVNVKGIPQPKVFKTKTGLKLGKLSIIKAGKKLAMYLQAKYNKLFGQSIAQAGIFESKILIAKKALKDAKKMMLTSLEYFNLHVNLAKAYLHLRTFKMSLPKYITNLLF